MQYVLTALILLLGSRGLSRRGRGAGRTRRKRLLARGRRREGLAGAPGGAGRMWCLGGARGLGGMRVRSLGGVGRLQLRASLDGGIFLDLVGHGPGGRGAARRRPGSPRGRRPGSPRGRRPRSPRRSRARNASGWTRPAGRDRGRGVGRRAAVVSRGRRLGAGVNFSPLSDRDSNDLLDGRDSGQESNEDASHFDRVCIDDGRLLDR
ncbi:hypothetical protein B0T26DRAFT_769141 [Lasiosphaeria miniovina]|uniref:Uncharacterized protein n=1 Tax=Lasiosphaeria miniovina TaxID=1954250 RepID=A0AA40ATE0_9PEZI|nr:uncharacterized protein B0T26DRAFT_769141 [Lasiosphaeria miniovina]KAK0721632.1 hypothetical protein B0T26DRAFT_769141 [Lasiosphaeria miniovina]